MAQLRRLDLNGVTWHAISGYPKLVNLATNPSFEATDDTVTIWKNIVNNPSFESVKPGTEIVRRNLATAGEFQLTAKDNGATLEHNVSWNGGTWSRFTQGVEDRSISRLYVPLDLLIDGATYTVSWLVANDSSETVPVSIDWTDRNYENYQILPGEIKRIYTSATRDEYTDIYRFSDLQLNLPHASVLFKDILIEQTDQERPYFDGDTSDSLGYTYSYEWSDTAGPSPSVAQASTVEVSRNKIWNPAFKETSGATELRRNEVSDPRGTMSWTRYGSGTVEGNISVPFGPQEISTANRVSFVDGDTNVGVIFLDSVETNTEYTVSAWVYLETDLIESEIAGFQFAHQTVVSGINAESPIPKYQEWVRMHWTMQTGDSTSPLGFRYDHPNIVGSYLITGVLVEKTSKVHNYFDGKTTADTYNLALGADVSIPDGWMVTNGSTDSYSWLGLGSPASITIDLGEPKLIDSVAVWHYYYDGRTYHDTKTEISVNGIDWVTVFDSAVSGEYAETGKGNTIPFDLQEVRYIRDHANGSTANTSSHWVEIKAFNSNLDFNFSWTSDADASPSVQTAPLPDDWNIEDKIDGYTTSRNTLYTQVTDDTGSGGRSLQSRAIFGVANETVTLILRGRGFGGTFWNVGATQVEIPFTDTMQEFRFTFTFPNSNYLYIQNAPVIGQGFELEYLFLALGNYTGPYFDGSTPSQGDFIYSWTGTDDASESVSLAPKVNVNMYNSGTIAYQGNSDNDRSIVVKEGPYHPYLNHTLPAGTETYTILMEVKTPLDYIRVVDRSDGYGDPNTLHSLPTVPNEWTKIHQVLTRADSTSSNNDIDIGYESYHPLVGGYSIRYLSIIEGTYHGEYFDGDTIGNDPDFTYVWDGTPHDSASWQTAVGVQGTVEATDGNAKLFSYQHTEPNGEKSVRFLVPKGTNKALWRIAGVSAMDWPSIKKGKTYTLYVKYRGSEALEGTTLTLGLQNADSTDDVMDIQYQIPLNTDWLVYRRTFTALQDALQTTLLYPLLSSHSPTTDLTFDIAEWMILEGDYTDEPYFDGSFPETDAYIYSWTGDPNASSSIAMPR